MKTYFNSRTYITILITTICMSFVISLVIVLTIEGFSGPTFEHWLRSSLFAF